MKLRFPESDIKHWAKKNIYSREEKDLILQKAPVQNTGYLDKGQLQMVARWKAPRSAGHVTKNSDAFVKEVSEFALQSSDERVRIEALTLLDGVQWPTASVILHLFHTDPYPILDFRALWSVRLEVPKQYIFSFWWPYVEFTRKVAARNKVDMRTLDRALWQYSKESQRK